MTLFTHPDEVAAQVKTYAFLVGNINHDSGLTDDDCLGLLCIGYMISENVDAMIADFQGQITTLRKKTAEVPE